MLAKIARWKAVRVLASLQLTVLGLLLVALLVIAGTVLQAERGIYAAQKEVFQSWVFRPFLHIPLPGMLMAGALLFVNLLFAVLFRLKPGWPRLGIFLIHAGLLVLLGGGLVGARPSGEYFMTLREGEGSRMASAANQWELAVWTEAGGKRRVQAVDIDGLLSGRPWAVPELGLELAMVRFFPNCRLAEGMPTDGMVLKELPADDDPEQNIPGAIIGLRDSQGDPLELILFAGSDAPVTLSRSAGDRHFSLRLKRIVLPVRLKLLDFERTVHPGTELPRSFSSRVEIEGAGMRREALIAMNRPLRFGGYTFYQSSYGEDPQQGVTSTFAVAGNSGRWLPYLSSALIVAGMLWHFIALLASALVRTRREVGS